MTRTLPEHPRWLKRPPGTGAPPAARVFCFHHAGGSAALFRHWPDLLPRDIEPVAVQLPGRADRLRERPFTEMPPLVDALADVLAPVLDVPFACFGLSMGAKISWALAHGLGERGLPVPRALYLAGAAAPGTPEGRSDWHVPDEQLVAYLRDMDGTPPEVFAHPELLAALLPTLRADLTLVDTFRFEPGRPLEMPIHAFAGLTDVEGGPDRMRGWGACTRGAFTLEALSCGHFLDAAGERRVAEVIAAGF
ncbi:thioesterase II family protein [Amycolatopsis sacchari]|uniref:thioesterase II family protein n=1 Tax=Amycolatopsis sacchari TaxID=115433 RepID=UPI003D7146D3